MARIPFTRRAAFSMAGAALMFYKTPFALAASAFWNKKQPSEWTNDEITQLTTRSPWAKEVNAEFMQDTDYTSGGAAGPRIGRGGQIEAPGGTGQFEIGRDRSGSPAGARRRQPVTVRWENAQPILDALGKPLSGEFAERYVISVSGLPLGIMEKRRRADEASQPEDNSPAARQSRMIGQLKASATLEARGKEPEQAGVVIPARMPGTWLFGFSKELLPLDANDREILFTLKTGLMSIKARFEPKEMIYRGKVAL